ncbi:MAG: hypothetical protein E7668_05235 [Ruminococcaceae bacterium]|nr:hypothetical protein [Oscillospiraceae bacterium]
MIVAMLAALVIAALSGMGVGGGGLFVIYLSLFTDTPQLTAQGMNLLFFLFSSGASLPVHLLRRKLLLGVIVLMASAGIAGAFLGTLLARVVAGGLLRKIFGAMLVVSGIYSLKRKETVPALAKK